MDIRFIESLIAVVDEGSIAGAARAQLITPAAVSQRIQSLERALNCVLLSRAGHTVKPTEACFRILPRARNLISEAQSLVEDIDASGLTGTFRIGTNSTALIGIIPHALKDINREAPDAKFHITPGTSIELLHALSKNEIDAAIITMPPSKIPKSLHYQILRSEPLVLIHHKSIKGSITQILSEQPYIRYDPLCWGGLLAEQYLRNMSINVDPIYDLDSLEAITQLVAGSVGVSLVPAWIGLDHQHLGISMTYIEDVKYHRELIFIRNYHPRRPKLVDVFLSQLHQTRKRWGSEL